MNPIIRQAGLLLLLLGLVVWGQKRSGAYQDEFGSHPDEAAHFVSALMIRDYFVQLTTGGEEKITHPKRYAEMYYDHYPKVAIGNWPPGFHTLQALAMLLSKPGQGTVMAVMALLAMGVALLVYHSSKPHLGEGWALAAAILFLVLPIVQKYSSMLMTEIPMALLVFGGVLLYTKYVETGHWKWSAYFGLVAACAFMVKGTGLALGFIPPLSILFLKRWDLLKKPGFWLSAVVVLAVCAPWYVFTIEVQKAGWEKSEPSIEFFLQALVYNSKKLVETGGPVFLLGIVFGMANLRKESKGGVKGNSLFLPMLILLFFAVPLMHCIVPAGKEHRHLIPMLPAYVVLVAYGMRSLVVWIKKEKPGMNPKKLSWILAGCGLAGMFAAAKEPIYYKGYSGFREVATELYKVEDWPGPVLISSDASGEGMFIAEAALADNSRPSKHIVRVSKALGESKFSGADYEPLYKNQAELRKLLVEGNYWAIVIDGAVKKQRKDNYGKFQHMRDLEELCQELEFAERFTIHRGNTAYEGDLVLYRSPRFTDFSELDEEPPRDPEDKGAKE